MSHRLGENRNTLIFERGGDTFLSHLINGLRFIYTATQMHIDVLMLSINF